MSGAGRVRSLGVVTVASIFLLAGPASAAPRTGAPGDAGASRSVPHLPSVPLWVTDGVSEGRLYRQSLELSGAGRQDRPIQLAIARTQQALDADAILADHADQAERAADLAAAQAQRTAGRSSAQYRALVGAVRSSAIDLYMTGSGVEPGPPDLQAAGDAVWAEGLLQVTVSTSGVLAERQAVAGEATQAARRAGAELAVARREARQANAAVAAERAAGQRLEASLAAIDGADAAAVTHAHALLASEAGRELRDAGSLEFKTRNALPAPLSTAPVALAWAFAELGVPYLWGGTGVGGFDCSGLTQFVWGKAGVSIPRVAAAQYFWTDPVPLSQLEPGDLVFYVGSDGTPSSPGHVGIYIGDGLMIDAPYTGTVVQVNTIWWSDLIGFGRVHADGTPVASHEVPTRVDAVVGTKRAVPSETKPPPGYDRHHHGPGSTTTTTVPRRHRHHRRSAGSSTTTTTTLPGSTTTQPPPPTTTTLPGSTTTTVAGSTTTLPGL